MDSDSKMLQMPFLPSLFYSKYQKKIQNLTLKHNIFHHQCNKFGINFQAIFTCSSADKPFSVQNPNKAYTLVYSEKLGLYIFITA